MTEARERPISAHAADRARERKVSLDAIDAACRYGSRRRRGHRANRASSYTIDHAAVRRARVDGVDLARWLWTEVIVSREGVVVTCYRLAPALRRRHELRGGPVDDDA